MATMVQNAKKAPVTKEVTKADLKQAIDRLAAAVGKRLKVEEGSRGTKVVVLDGDRFRAPKGSPLKPGEAYEVVEAAKGHVTLKAGDKQVHMHKANVAPHEEKRPASSKPAAKPAKKPAKKGAR